MFHLTYKYKLQLMQIKRYLSSLQDSVGVVAYVIKVFHMRIQTQSPRNQVRWKETLNESDQGEASLADSIRF